MIRLHRFPITCYPFHPCRGFAAGWLLMLLMLLGAPVAAQTGPAKLVRDDERINRIQSVARLAGTAESARDYSGIVDSCQSILDEAGLQPGHRQYLTRLQAWALNRRAETRMELAEQFEAAGNSPQADQVRTSARADLDQAIAADPEKWQAWRNRAMMQTVAQAWPAAIADWTRVIELRTDHPESRVAHFNRAELYLANRQFEPALADYRQVLEADNADRGALNGCGNCLLALGQPVAAIEYYDRILQAEPENPGALVNRGDAWYHQGRWENAELDYRASFASQESGRTRQRLAWLLATCPDEEIRDPAEALESARQAIALDGESAEYLNTLAAAFAAGQDFDRARDVQTRAIALMETADEGYAVRQTMYENNRIFLQPDEDQQ